VSGGTGAGLALALLSAIAYNSGLIVEKQALLRLPTLNGRRLASFALNLLSSRRWLIGFGLMLCGLGLQVAALLFAPVTVVQPVVAGGVAVVLILSRLVLREHLGRVEYSCVAVMAVSVVLLALSAGGASGVGHQVSGIELAAIAIPSCQVAVLIGLSTLRAGARKHRPPATGVSYGIAAGLLYGVAALAIKALSGALLDGHGIIGVVTAVLSSPYLYVMAACSAAGLVLFQTALQRCRISIVAPVSNVLGSMYFIVVATWLFHERLPTSPALLALRLIGIGAACAVVAVLSAQGDPARSAPQARPARPAQARRAPPQGEPGLGEGGTYLALGGEAHGPGRGAA
jgi:drug/metabolite transporter (DMT)-like permease